MKTPRKRRERSFGLPGGDKAGGKGYHMIVRRKLLLLLLPFLLLAPFVGAQTEQTTVVFTENDDDGSVHFYASNRAVVPAWISISMETFENLTSEEDFPFAIAVSPQTDRLFLFTISPVDISRSRSYRYRYSATVGDPSSAHHDDSYLYLFPYAHGTKHRITQGYNGSFSHFGENQYALDFDLDEGTEIYAARGGIVAEVKEDSRIGGTSSRYANYGNYIRIAHDDGTFGNYVHLRYGGAEVEEGDIIEAGQFIGYSGNTGLSSGPHLHFDVRVPQTDGTMQSIPVRFRDIDGSAVDPQEDDIFYAFHPGKPPFEVSFGADLTVEDFQGYSAEIPVTGSLDFRSEQTDLTFVLYLQNGLDYDIEATIDLRLVGMTSDIVPPIELIVESGTERFMTLLRADPEANRWQWAPSVSYRRR